MLTTLKRQPLKALLLLGLLAALPFAAFACGDDDDDDETQTSAPTSSTGSPTPAASPTESEDGMDYGDLSGDVDIDGSSTVFPITSIAAEEFAGVSDVNVNVALSGTGGGFEKFCRGETQISDASRPIEDDEIAACAAEGITDIVELQVAIDALTIVVNPDNDWATCMTVDEIVSIFKDGGVRNWKDVRAGFPDEEIVLYYPGADSGTFDYFVEVLEDVDDTNVHASDGTSSEDDNVLVIGVEGDPGAIGYFGLAYYVEAGSGLNAVEVDDGNGCVAPSAEAAQSGEYAPYSRPLFIYTRESFLEERPEVLGFINFYFENLEDFVDETGYATLSEDLKAEQYAKVEPFLP